MYERGGTLGYGAFTPINGIKATSLSAQGSGYALAVDNHERLRQFDPLTREWNYLNGPAGHIAVNGGDLAQSIFMLATPTQGTNYTLHAYNLGGQTWSSENFMGTSIGVGPNGDPWVIRTTSISTIWRTACSGTSDPRTWASERAGIGGCLPSWRTSTVSARRFGGMARGAARHT